MESNSISWGQDGGRSSSSLHCFELKTEAKRLALLSCLGKFTTILNARLIEFCENNSVIKEMQAGFQQGYSTIDNVFVIKNLRFISLQEEETVLPIYRL